MKQEEIDEIMKKIDKRCKLPKHWDSFISKQVKSQNILIKDSKTHEFYCTNCNHSFKNMHLKVGELERCPNCNQKYKIYGSNYYEKNFEKSVILVQKIDKQVVIRIFEIWSFFKQNNVDSKKDKVINRDTVEYARILPGVGEFIGDNVYFYWLGMMYIGHYKKFRGWYEYNGYRVFTHFPIYPFNKKQLIKGTKLEYAPIKEFQERFHNYNFLDTIQIAIYDSFELLWKLKLYNLSKFAKKFNKNGTFYQRFKVPKNFLNYMQNIDIEYYNLKILQLVKEQPKDIIHKCIENNYGYNNIRFFKKEKALKEFINFADYNDCYLYNEDLKFFKKLKNYIPINKALKYARKWNNLRLYKDYLEMADRLALNYKSKSDLFPDNLIERHNELQTKIKVNSDIKMKCAAHLRFLELSKYIYSNDKYIIFPAPDIDSMKDEGKQQGNCVARLYLDPYIKEETEIFFIRKLDNITKSCITLEFSNGKIKQKELPHHSINFTSEQLEFIDNWVRFREFMDQKEKYRQKTEIKIKQYKLNKLVA